jgi:ubiquitin carboxyl-terminal hydrolase 25/28
MDRFLDTADPGKRAKSKEVQAELNTRRERLRLLTQDKVRLLCVFLVN